MDHADHVALIRAGVEPGGAWADLGSGTGAFTLALAELLGPAGIIYSIDRDRASLREQQRRMRERFPATEIYYQVADFTAPLDLPPLDGIVLANSLHFQPDAGAVVARLRDLLRPAGRLVVVEYDTDRGNRWVPYPVSYSTWQTVAVRAGYTDTRLLASRPSRFLGAIYAALSVWPGTATPTRRAIP
ncbi:MAG TPA: methyltransferase domain-containing protein [Thermomicrobiales bacterium]|nr:methyltransferase domain-containing protein [Thermomicrobiales bacterium]